MRQGAAGGDWLPGVEEPKGRAAPKTRENKPSSTREKIHGVVGSGKPLQAVPKNNRGRGGREGIEFVLNWGDF